MNLKIHLDFLLAYQKIYPIIKTMFTRWLKILMILINWKRFLEK
jgi:hypothetical protein